MRHRLGSAAESSFQHRFPSNTAEICEEIFVEEVVEPCLDDRQLAIKAALDIHELVFSKSVLSKAIVVSYGRASRRLLEFAESAGLYSVDSYDLDPQQQLEAEVFHDCFNRSHQSCSTTLASSDDLDDFAWVWQSEQGARRAGACGREVTNHGRETAKRTVVWTVVCARRGRKKCGISGRSARYPFRPTACLRSGTARNSPDPRSIRGDDRYPDDSNQLRSIGRDCLADRAPASSALLACARDCWRRHFRLIATGRARVCNLLL